MSNRLPAYFKQEISDNETLRIAHLISEFGVNTVCKEAKCPNINHCFKHKQITFMILGDTCTRNCRFCAVNPVRNTTPTKLNSKISNGVNKSKENALIFDEGEPYRISQIVKILDLKYVVITSVTRDDLTDGGAAEFAKAIELIKAIGKNIKVEVLIPDFRGNIPSLKSVIDAGPAVAGHNIETVERLYKELKPKANYQLSLEVLKKIKEINPSLITKSSIILGLGETEDEIVETMEDLRKVQCDILTLGQYLAPSPQHYPTKEFISIEKFQRYKDIGMALGFKAVSSAPLVRSSYHADQVYKEIAYV